MIKTSNTCELTPQTLSYHCNQLSPLIRGLQWVKRAISYLPFVLLQSGWGSERLFAILYSLGGRAGEVYLERAGSLFGRSIKRITSSHVFLRGVGILSILAFVVVRWGSGGLHSEVNWVPPLERIKSICLNCVTNGKVATILRVKNLLERLTGGNRRIFIWVSINKVVLSNSKTNKGKLTITSLAVM